MKFYEVLSNSMTLQNIVKPKILRKIKMRKKIKNSNAEKSKNC